MSVEEFMAFFYKHPELVDQALKMLHEEEAQKLPAAI